MQANAVKVSKRLLNKPRKPVELAADVVERVIATGGETYLQTYEHKLRWWQLCLLDVKLFLACVTVVVLGLAAVMVRLSGSLLVRLVKAMAGPRQNRKSKAA